MVLADRSDAVHEAAEELRWRRRSGRHHRPADVARLFDTAERVDVLVNNAGIITISKLEELTLDDWDRVLRVNTTGVFLCCQAAAARMRAQAAAGKSSTPPPDRRARASSSPRTTPHRSSASSGSPNPSPRNWRRTRSPSMRYCPGIVGSDMWSYNDREWGRLLGDYKPGELMEEWVAGIPLGRAGTNDDVASLLLFLASSEAAYITGQTINVDGGMFMN